MHIAEFRARSRLNDCPSDCLEKSTSERLGNAPSDHSGAFSAVVARMLCTLACIRSRVQASECPFFFALECQCRSQIFAIATDDRRRVLVLSGNVQSPDCGLLFGFVRLLCSSHVATQSNVDR
jgi:hypothetical protein